jgi:cellulose synthase/poly-beta-1,6-N-acetylglucosamine synthase-like glycosyltransferase
MFIGLLSLITLIVCLSQIISFRRLYIYVEKALAQTNPNWCPKAAIILPCKGLDPGFADNVARLLDQDYKNFEVVFATATDDDPAYPVLQELSLKSKDISVKVVVSGINPERAQKLNNQLEALKHISDDVEVLVFVDSDMMARPDFLRQLVSPLKDLSVGTTTGYRFYVPERGDWPSLVRALWNRMTAWEMAHPDYAFAWGGAMAIRKSTFDQAEVSRHWQKACDDDLSLTTAIKKLGLSVCFVPQCLVASEGDASLAEIVEWTNRQLILTKVYYPHLWKRAIQKATVMVVWLITILTSVFGGLLLAKADWLWASAIGALILPIEFWFLIRAQKLWQKVLPDQRQFLDRSFWQFSLALPVAHIVLPWMTLYSLLTNRISWRGITYELRSPSETIIVKGLVTEDAGQV